MLWAAGQKPFKVTPRIASLEPRGAPVMRPPGTSVMATGAGRSSWRGDSSWPATVRLSQRAWPSKSARSTPRSTLNRPSSTLTFRLPLSQSAVPATAALYSTNRI